MTALLLLALRNLLIPQCAHAGSFYYEIQGGLSRYLQASPFFNSSGQNSTDFGYALNNAIFVKFARANTLLSLQLGVQHRLSSVSSTTSSFALQTVYPELRIQFSQFYVSAGYTPFVWKRISNQSGVDYFSRANNSTAAVGEVGFLWPVTPKFSLGAQTGVQVISASGVQSPKPAWDGTISMRFYFGWFNRSGEDGSSSEYLGRYPFGEIR